MNAIKKILIILILVAIAGALAFFALDIIRPQPAQIEKDVPVPLEDNMAAAPADKAAAK